MAGVVDEQIVVRPASMVDALSIAGPGPVDDRRPVPVEGRRLPASVMVRQVMDAVDSPRGDIALAADVCEAEDGRAVRVVAVNGSAAHVAENREPAGVVNTTGVSVFSVIVIGVADADAAVVPVGFNTARQECAACQ